MDGSLFTLSWLGGAAERCFRRRRPGVDELPWGTLDPRPYPPELVLRARFAWTDGAFVEYATAAQLADIVRGLIAVGAPIDLVGMAGEFVADEMLHVELHARVLHELGGAVPYRVDTELVAPPVAPERPLLSLAAAIVRTCCVGESLAVPMLAATRNVATQPLVEAVLARIVEDEGPHALLGWLFLDWADLDDPDRRVLARVAHDALADARKLARTPTSRVLDGRTTEGFRLDDLHALGWLDSEAYTPAALDALDVVEARLVRAGIDPHAAP